MIRIYNKRFTFIIRIAWLLIYCRNNDDYLLFDLCRNLVVHCKTFLVNVFHTARGIGYDIDCNIVNSSYSVANLKSKW